MEDDQERSQQIPTPADLSEEMKSAMLPVTVVICVASVLGLVGNILIILVCGRRYSHCNFRYFVLFMAVIDLTSCITTLPGEIISYRNWYNYKHEWICKAKSYFNIFTTWGSALTLLLLAFDRYRKIVHPLQWQLQPSSALKLCITGVFVSAVVAAPVTVLWGKQYYIYNRDGYNITVCICEKSSEYADDIYPLVYISCAYIPVGLILITICALNVCIGRQMFCVPRAFRGNVTCSDSVSQSNSNTSFYENTNTHGIHSLNGGTDKRRTIISGIASITDTFIRNFIHKTVMYKPSAALSNFYLTNSSSVTFHLTDNLEDNVNIESIEATNNIGNTNSIEETCKTEILSSAICSTSDVRDKAVTRSESEPTKAANNIETTNAIVTRCNTESLSDAATCSSSSIKDSACSWSGSVSSIQTSGSRESRRNARKYRQKSKTLIMLVLTSVFVITVGLYLVLICTVASRGRLLSSAPDSQKVVFLSFLRLYFINYLINPILYGYLDPRFRQGLKDIFTHVK